MQLKYCTIEIDAEELATIGEALCITISKTLEDFADKDLDVDDWIQEYRAMLIELTGAGYQLWVDAGEQVLRGYHTIDVDDWIEKEKMKSLNNSLKKPQ